MLCHLGGYIILAKESGRYTGNALGSKFEKKFSSLRKIGLSTFERN